MVFLDYHEDFGWCGSAKAWIHFLRETSSGDTRRSDPLSFIKKSPTRPRLPLRRITLNVQSVDYDSGGEARPHSLQAEDIRQLADLLQSRGHSSSSTRSGAVVKTIQHLVMLFDDGDDDSPIAIDDCVTKQLCRFLQNLPFHITKVALERGGSSAIVNSQQLVQMLAALSANQHLTELKVLDLCSHRITVEGLRVIANQLIPQNELLEELNLSRCGLGNQGCSIIMRAAFNDDRSKIHTLRLNRNEFSKFDLDVIELLKSNTRLRRLDLAGQRYGQQHPSKFGDTGAALLATALTVNKGLRHLDLSHNDIGDRGCMALGRALQGGNQMLEHLNVYGNNFGDVGVRSFAKALTTNRSLRFLNLMSSSSISVKTAEEMVRVVRRHLLPLEVIFEWKRVCQQAKLRSACRFSCYFSDCCQKLREGTMSDDHPSFRKLVSLLGSRHLVVKRSVLFLLTRQRAEIASQSLLLSTTTSPPPQQQQKKGKKQEKQQVSKARHPSSNDSQTTQQQQPRKRKKTSSKKDTGNVSPSQNNDTSNTKEEEASPPPATTGKARNVRPGTTTTTTTTKTTPPPARQEHPAKKNGRSRHRRSSGKIE